MKRVILLFIFSIFVFSSCKTGTLVVVPIPNIEIPIYPPQTNLSYNNNIYSNMLFNDNLNIYGFNGGLFNNGAILFNGTNNLFKKNFVYLK